MKEGSKLILAPSRFGSDGFQGRSSSRGVLLRPSALAEQASRLSQPDTQSTPPGSTSSFVLKPPVLLNPFNKTPEESESRKEDKPNTEDQSSKIEDVSKVDEPSKVEESSKITDETNTEKDVETPKQDESASKKIDEEKPSDSKTASSSVATTSNAANEVIFGENLSERIVNPAPTPQNGVFGSDDKAKEMLFSSAVQQNKSDDTNGDASSSKYSKSLTESAREYESRQPKRKYDEVEVKTGEENESNVLQLTCKLHVFDSVLSNWNGLGTGQLRLNDIKSTSCIASPSASLQSRVVVRTTGSLRVILNTKIWPGMWVNRASTKSIRLSAMDNDTIKIYLITTGLNDTDKLYKALSSRVTAVRESEADFSSPSILPQSSDDIVSSASPTPPSSPNGDSSLDATSSTSSPTPTKRLCTYSEENKAESLPLPEEKSEEKKQET